MKLCWTLVLIGLVTESYSNVLAQAPAITIDAQRSAPLAAAQIELVQAYARIGDAQHTSDAHLGGHAEKAKELISQANQELLLAAQEIAPGQQPAIDSAPVRNVEAAIHMLPNVAGDWTIYAYNVHKAGSSLKTVQISQDGNILSGTFHGPHQHGKLQGWVNGNYVEFSTDTREILTFRGEITSAGMAGIYGVNGQHAEWKAERTNE